MAHRTVAVSNRIFPEVLAWLSARVNVVANEDPEPWSPDALTRHCADAHALMAFMTDRIDADLVRACPRLKVIACGLKGYDNVDVAACTAAGITVTIAPDLLTAPTAELAVGLTLALCRNILRGDAYVRSGAFQGWRPHLYGLGLQGSTVGLVGMGAVGRAIAARLAAFGPRIIYADPQVPSAPHGERVAWPQLLADSDVLIAAVPLTPATVRLIDARALARVRPTCRLVNVGRGSVVDEYAVARALANGRLGGYAADVFALEDWARPDRPRRIPSVLLDCANTVFTPHLGSAVEAARRAIEMAAAQDIIAVLQGQTPAGVINAPGNGSPPVPQPSPAASLTGSAAGKPPRGGRPASRLPE